MYIYMCSGRPEGELCANELKKGENKEGRKGGRQGGKEGGRLAGTVCCEDFALIEMFVAYKLDQAAGLS